MSLKKNRVAVAMSGGVDSAVAAGLLLEQGYDVTGVTMDLFDLPKEFCRDGELKSCCGLGAVQDAVDVARTLGIPHYVIDVREAFETRVVRNFCEEYARGRTPNPCLRCNTFIKFEELIRRLHRLDISNLATGHHARIERDPRTGLLTLKRGKDPDKDQSYFLYTLTQKQLGALLFPVGQHLKTEIRGLARKWGLPVASRPESQEICFIPSNDYSKFLETRMPGTFRAGPLVTREGRVIGRHGGLHRFTVGQRRGIGVAAPHPLYVLALDAARNQVMVGEDRELKKKRLLVSGVHWISGKNETEPLEIEAKIRYKHKPARAFLRPLPPSEAAVEFKTGQRALTPGQAVVFYDRDRVLGGGTIERALD